MIKKTFIVATAIFALALGTAPAWAEEVDCTTNPEAEACPSQGEYGIMPISETGETMPISDNPEDHNQDSDGTPVRDHDYPESDNEIIEETEIIEEETEPALWPMYLSLGALGLALIVFIILNLFGGKKRK